MMQSTKIGEDIPKTGSNFIRVKKANEKVTFRIAQEYDRHTGKHFLTDEEGKWNVVPCPRINTNGEEECEHCNEFFELMAQAKKAEASGDKKAASALKEDARKDGRAVAMEFYYSVLNRDTQTAGILQTTYGVKKGFDDKANNGVKIMERDFVLKNTGKPGAARYALDVVDSADSLPLSEKEQEEYLKAQSYDMNQINSGGNTDTEEPPTPTEDTEQVKAAKKIFEEEGK